MNRLLLNCLLACGCFAFAAPNTAAPNTAAQVEAARRAGHYAEALALVQSLPATADLAAQRARQAAVAAVQYDWAASLLTASPALALPHYEAALALDRAPRPAEAADDLNGLGVAYEQTSRPDKALALLGEALPLYRKVGNKQGEANALMNSADCDADLNRLDEALGLHRQALALFQQSGNAAGEVKAFTNLGNVYSKLGQPARALSFYQQALARRRASGGPALGPTLEPNLLLDMGNAEDQLHHYARAVALYQQALPGLRRAGERDGEARALADLGNAYTGLGEYRKALDFYRQSLPLFQQAGDKRGAAQMGVTIGTAQERLKGH